MDRAVIDIGNTNTKAGLVREEALVETRSFPSASPSAAEITAWLEREHISNVTMCSVKPMFQTELAAALQERAIVPEIIDYRTLPLKLHYKPPSDVGSDRLVTAFAVLKRFAVDAVIVDMGTAITFEMVTCDGGYHGGLIFPGLALLLDSLSEKTALIPRVTLDRKTYPLIGQTTDDAVAGGVIGGVAALIPAMVERLGAGFEGDFRVFVTGGGAERFIKDFPPAWTYVPDIILDGLILLGEPVHGV